MTNTIADKKSAWIMGSNTCKLLALAISAAIWTPYSVGAETTPDVDTTAAIKAVHWGNNVTLTFNTDTVTLVSNGIPNHPRPIKYLLPKTGVLVPASSADLYVGDDPTAPQNFSYTLPIHPRKKAAATSTGFGPIGILMSGAALFNPYEGDNKSIALDHNVTVDGVSFIDQCNGHPSVAPFIYHYHGVPYCITGPIDKTGEHSKMIGVAFDGFPIYGPLGKDGLTPEKLDECNGHTEKTGEFTQGIYHYHLTKSSPYSVACLAGEVPATIVQEMASASKKLANSPH
jgi:YHYH protein